jgi:FKBP-type peptidyl-prolyl cis-trans isomerase SlyD
VKETEKPEKIEDGVVVTLDYTLTVEGEVVDSSEEDEPIQFIQGQEHIIPGLERELYGLKIGDDKQVTLSPQDGYGEIEPEAGMDVPRGEFPPEIPLEIGTGLQLKTQEGEIVNARIASITPDSVRLDFNHQLAGKELQFDVKVVDLRQATDQEIAHGHLHDGHDHH